GDVVLVDGPGSVERALAAFDADGNPRWRSLALAPARELAGADVAADGSVVALYRDGYSVHAALIERNGATRWTRRVAGVFSFDPVARRSGDSVTDLVADGFGPDGA